MMNSFPPHNEKGFKVKQELVVSSQQRGQVVSKKKLSVTSSDKENMDPTSRFMMKNVGKSASSFIEENTAKNTLKNNNTAVNLWNEFMTEVHPELKFSFETIPLEDLARLLCEFFMMIAKEDGTEHNASTVETFYQSLARVVLDLRKINIKTEPGFSELRKVLSRRQKLSCEKGEIPGKHKSQVIEAPILAECWATGAFGTENPRALVATVLLQVQSAFGTRGKTELWNMTNSDILIGPER